ncbi:MAG TPA: hypothetical protein VKX49_08715 [Bryobacteraceae bacterium]|nr:hypothetical protein [Bryobacteraceae bacterium]
MTGEVGILRYARVLQRFTLERVSVAALGRLGGQPGYIVGPFGLGAHALANYGFDSIAQFRAAILARIVFQNSFVVIDEQARGREKGLTLLLAFEIDSRGDRIRGAASEVLLIVNRRQAAGSTQVAGGRERDAFGDGEHVVRGVYF